MRQCDECRRLRWHYPFENGAIKMDAFAVEGRVIYEIHLWRHFWKEVERGDVGLNPIKLFSLSENELPPLGYVN